MKQTLVRGQDAREFTVRVQHLKTGETVGTGFVVSADGKIITCAHVVVAAGVDPLNGKRIPSIWELSIASLGFGSTEEIPASDHVGIYFPQLSQNKLRRATVIAAICDAEDDVVLLQLVERSSPLGPDKIARLGAAQNSTGHPFNTFGYRRLGQYVGLPGLGTIVGLVEKPEDRQLQYDRVMLTSQNIDSGMSGAAVLDRELNLVVGVIAETPDAIEKLPDRDTSIAVDVLTFRSSPFDIPFLDGPCEPGPSPLPPPESLAASPERPRDAVRWNNAPNPGNAWVGRTAELVALTADLARGNCYLSSVVGFGGEGKSSLLRRWIDNLLSDSSHTPPEGVFWWTFNTADSADQFFEAALEYVGGSTTDSSELLSSSARAHFIAARLYQHRFLFVLDGMEVLQKQHGDHFGELTNSALRELLIYFANGGHKSFCLIASRVLPVELMPYSTHSPHDLTRLTADEGAALLQNLGVKGPPEEVRRMTEEWDGHALTLTLLSAYLTELYDGDVGKRRQIPLPSEGRQRWDSVSRVLDTYIEHLSPTETSFLSVFSLFRKSVPESSFPFVFQKEMENDSLRAPLTTLSQDAFQALVVRLVNYRLLRTEANRKHYTTHPLIRGYFHSRIDTADPRIRNIHLVIAEFYLHSYTSRGEPPEVPTLEELAPLFETIHHACQGGAYDGAWRVYRDLIDRGKEFVLTKKLGASDTGLDLLLEFFPGGDTSKDPLVSDLTSRGAIVNRVGVRLQDIGQLAESLPFIERALQITLQQGEFVRVAVDYMNLSEIHAFLGVLDASADNARRAIEFANQAHESMLVSQAMTNLAWAQHLQGEESEAKRNFEAAERLSTTLSGHPHLQALSGFWYAHFLERHCELALARTIMEQSIQIAERRTWMRYISRGHTVLADLDSLEHHLDSARKHAELALKIARGISYRPALMDALLSRGRWAVRAGQRETADNDLNEALTYAITGGYRIYEVDVRVALAFMYLGDGRAIRAASEAERAARMSVEMSYHWGQVDSADVLEAIGSAEITELDKSSSGRLPAANDDVSTQ